MSARSGTAGAKIAMAFQRKANPKEYIKRHPTHLKYLYRVCHGFRLTKQEDYFRVNFDHFRSKLCFFRQLGQVASIGLSVKPNHHLQF